jgi:hypothetical protein
MKKRRDPGRIFKNPNKKENESSARFLQSSPFVFPLRPSRPLR